MGAGMDVGAHVHEGKDTGAHVREGTDVGVHVREGVYVSVCVHVHDCMREHVRWVYACVTGGVRQHICMGVYGCAWVCMCAWGMCGMGGACAPVALQATPAGRPSKAHTCPPRPTPAHPGPHLPTQAHTCPPRPTPAHSGPHLAKVALERVRVKAKTANKADGGQEDEQQHLGRKGL